jgi:WD40 repeat protein
MVPGVSCACISDDYLAIAVEGVCFVFTLQGGRWLYMPSIDTGAIEKITFSPAGDVLLAITKVRINNESKRRALLYLKANFTTDLRDPDSVKTVTGNKIAEWPSSCEIVDVVFSDDGRKIAISTGHDSSGYSTIWLLKEGPTNAWVWKEGTVQVLNKMDATSPGIKGMSLYALLHIPLLIYIVLARTGN